MLVLPIALLAHTDDHDISGLRHTTPLDGRLTPFRRLGPNRREGAGSQSAIRRDMPGLRCLHPAAQRQGRRLRVLQGLPSRRDPTALDSGAGPGGDEGVARSLRTAAVVVRLVDDARARTWGRGAHATRRSGVASGERRHVRVRDVGRRARGGAGARPSVRRRWRSRPGDGEDRADVALPSDVTSGAPDGRRRTCRSPGNVDVDPGVGENPALARDIYTARRVECRNTSESRTGEFCGLRHMGRCTARAGIQSAA